MVVGKFNDFFSKFHAKKGHVPKRENTHVHYVHTLQLVFELAQDHSHPKKT
jgi:hypothetical protein